MLQKRHLAGRVVVGFRILVVAGVALGKGTSAMFVIRTA
jgi:hypothetical protein